MGNKQSTPVTEASGPVPRPADEDGNMIDQIIRATKRVIKNNKEIIKELDLILKQISGHRLAVNISQTVASGGAVTGAVMAFTPLLPIGFLVGSAVMGGGAAIGDLVVTAEKAKEATRIVDRGNGDMEELQEKLSFLKDKVQEIKEQIDNTARDTATLEDSNDNASEIQGTTGPEPVILEDSIGNTSEGRDNADVAFTVLIKYIIKNKLSKPADIAKVVPSAVVSVTTVAGAATGAIRIAAAADDFILPIGKLIGTASLKIAPGALKVISGVLGAVGAAVDVGVTIAGWVMQNPTAEQVKKVIAEIEVRIEELEEMKESFEKLIEDVGERELSDEGAHEEDASVYANVSLND